jgi:ketosteroid isomerase-like protein
MTRRSSFVFTVTMVAVVACATPAPAPPDTNAVRADIVAHWNAFETAWQAENVAAATKDFFTDDAINVVPGAPITRGRPAIDSSFATFHATTKVVSIKQTTDEVAVNGDLAYERGSYVQQLKQGAAAPTEDRARYLAIWRRQADGKWKCSRFVISNGPTD